MKTKIKRQFILTILSLAIITGFFSIPIYKHWLSQKIIFYYQEFASQKNKMSIDERYQYRYGRNYTSHQNLKKYFDDNGIENPVIFLPPKKYLAKSRDQYDWGETLSFYYFTGIKPVDLLSDDNLTATHALTANESRIQVIPIENYDVLMRVIQEYKKYE